METLSIILNSIQNYILQLDWPYIFTFIILCYGINHYKAKDGIQKATGMLTRTRYRVILVGLIYGIVIYFLRGYTLGHVENLFQSLVFALVFHKLIVEALIYWLAKHGLPQSVSKHLLSEEQLQKTGREEDENK